jgi:hypothetical protein
MYSEAETLSGVLIFYPSAHKYSYLMIIQYEYNLGPADMMGHYSVVQNSISVP